MLLGGNQSLNSQNNVELNDAWNEIDKILERIVPPVFPENEYSVLKYGACPDGVTDTRDAINSAIDICSAEGGGKVILPQGNYLVNGPLILKSNVNLHLEEGAYVRFGTNPKDYLIGEEKYNGCVKVRWEGTWCYNYSPLIYCWGANNVAITGKGTIDGQVDKYWFEWKFLQKPDQSNLQQMGENLIPIDKRLFGEGHYLRPGTIEFYYCKNVLVEGITSRMPIERNIHPTFCDNVIIRNVNIQPGVKKIRNDDGIDPDSCIDVLIENCTIHAYDDAIVVKSGRDNDAWSENGGRSSENIIIRNNKMLGGHNGFSIGSDMAGGVRNVFVYNCEMGLVEPMQYGINIKANSDRGGIVENIFVKDIKIDSCESAIYIETDYKNIQYDSIEHPYPPLYKNMFFNNINCKVATQIGIYIQGIEVKPIENINLCDISILKAKLPYTLNNINSLSIINLQIN